MIENILMGSLVLSVVCGSVGMLVVTILVVADVVDWFK